MANFSSLLFLGTLLIPIQTSAEELLFPWVFITGFWCFIQKQMASSYSYFCSLWRLHYANPEVDQFGLGIMFYYIGTGFFFGNNYLGG